MLIKTENSMEEVFNNNIDMVENNSCNSYLWELQSLVNHYCPEINKMIKVNFIIYIYL